MNSNAGARSGIYIIARVSAFQRSFHSLILSDIIVCTFNTCLNAFHFFLIFLRALNFALAAMGCEPAVAANTAGILGPARRPRLTGFGPRAGVQRPLLYTVK